MEFEYIDIIKIIAYFIVYSFIGWAIESVYKSYLQKKLINTGFLNGPICPIYGIGALIMFLFLNKINDNLFLVFIVGFIVLSIWEYIVGYLLEKFFHTKYWDYTGNKFNIKGRVCLFNSTAWGFLSVLFIHFWHPFIVEKIDSIPENILITIVWVLSAYILIDTTQSIIKLKTLDKKLEKLKELNQTIKEKLSELNNIKTEGANNLQELIETLQVQQKKLKTKVLKQTTRLKKAFPTMKSEKITEFLSQKLEEIREIKDRII